MTYEYLYNVFGFDSDPYTSYSFTPGFGFIIILCSVVSYIYTTIFCYYNIITVYMTIVIVNKYYL